MYNAAPRCVRPRNETPDLASSGSRMTKARSHRWEFPARFRKNAFGWRSRPAIERVKQAVNEIRKVARTDGVLAAKGAVTFLERVSSAIEQVDSSSGAVGTAVNNAVEALATVIAAAPASPEMREEWLERLWVAHEEDRIPYIESLADHWGELCASKEVASAWADRLLAFSRTALSPEHRGIFHGTSACLSALYRAERYAEIIDLLRADTIWPYKRWAVRAFGSLGEISEAIRYAESCRGWSTHDGEIEAVCEEILLAAGLIEEAYERYGARASRGPTHLATFRAVARKYPHKSARQILADLANATPGQEGKWFATAKEAGQYKDAITLASRSPSDPKTLTRAARDFAKREPAFAVAAGLLAIRWLVAGYGYEVEPADVWAAYTSTMKAAQNSGNATETRERVRQLVSRERRGGIVAKSLGSALRP